MARHMAQHEQQPLKFFPFDVREQHNFDAIAQDHLAQALTDHAKDAAVRGEYIRQDRYWRVMYYTYRQFKSHYDACINRILDASEHGNDLQNHRPRFTIPQAIPLREPPGDLKEQVKSRDGFRCLCCGYGKQRIQLQVDHISPSSHGGNHHFDNLQTLCKTCNDAKGIEKISFRNNQSTLTAAPSRLPVLRTPIHSYAKDPSGGKCSYAAHSTYFFAVPLWIQWTSAGGASAFGAGRFGYSLATMPSGLSRTWQA